MKTTGAAGERVAAANKEIDKNVYTLGSQPRQWQSLTA